MSEKVSICYMFGTLLIPYFEFLLLFGEAGTSACI